MKDVRTVDIVASNGQATKRAVGLTFVDAFGHVAEAYGAGERECLLVRPDGYVGWIGPPDKLADLHGYLPLSDRMRD